MTMRTVMLLVRQLTKKQSRLRKRTCHQDKRFQTNQENQENQKEVDQESLIDHVAHVAHVDHVAHVNRLNQITPIDHSNRYWLDIHVHHQV